ncbi:MAG: hypothetical protein GXP25_08580 [Planctomycetes bacterium]|nr:hypothetical protein [Planctomycetota bacterium]
MKWNTRTLSLAILSLTMLTLLLLSSTPAIAQGRDPLRFVRGERIATIWGGLALASLIIVLSIGVGGLAIQLWARVTFPQRTAAILKALEEKRWKLFLVGLVNVSFLFFLSYGFAQVRWLQWLAMLIATVLLAVVFLGLLGKAERLGARILDEAGRMPTPVGSILVGWPVLYFVAIIPFLGWALFLYLIISGTGAVVLSLIGNTRTPTEEPAKQNT